MLSRLATRAIAMDHARARSMIIACGLLIGTVLACGAAWTIAELRPDDLGHTGNFLAKLAPGLADERGRALHSAELLQLGLIADLRELGIDSPATSARRAQSYELREDPAPRIKRHGILATLALDDAIRQLVLAEWQREARALIAITLIAECMLAAGIVLALWHLRNQQVIQAAQARAEERERSAQLVQRQSRRFDLALNNMAQGLLMFDHTGHLAVVNQQFAQMFRIPDGALFPGMAYRELADAVVAAGQVSAEEMRSVRERPSALLARNGAAILTWELASGRSFSVRHQPFNDGWLSTFEEISERRAAEARLQHLAEHDALTDLPNRAQFRDRLQHALASVRRGRLLAVLCLDLDHFKTINDTLGHPFGDTLLKAVARRIAKQVRDFDVVARLDGDEFGVIQTAIDRPSDATALATRLIKALEAPFDIDGQRIVIGTSIGITIAPQDGLDPDQLLRCTYLALDRAEADGRGIYRLFDAEMDAQMQARRRIEIDLRQALQVGQFEMHYQPLVDLRQGKIAGFEALLRWRHPTRGLVPPGEFIPLAEEIGLITEIGEWGLRQACAAAASWPDGVRVAVNLSPAQFRSHDLVDTAARALAEAGLSADRLELEITETVMLQETEATLVTLRSLRALGIHIAMDDFGTGYSSLSHLRRFPFDRIKIDRSFVRDLGRRDDCSAIVRAVTRLSADLGMATTAEGVETKDQLLALEFYGVQRDTGVSI